MIIFNHPIWVHLQHKCNTAKQKRLTINLLSSAYAVWTGLEPATPCVTGRYSNQLNYHTKNFAAKVILFLIRTIFFENLFSNSMLLLI